MGVGHALSMLGGLIAILHAYAGGRLSVALNAVEFAAMIGLLGGAGLVALLPRVLAWKTGLLVSCVSQVIALAVLPAVIARLPRRGAHATTPGLPRAATATFGVANLAPLAFAAGAAVAVAYASVEQLVIPVRGSREFGLDRAGIAQIFMLMLACDRAALVLLVISIWLAWVGDSRRAALQPVQYPP